MIEEKLFRPLSNAYSLGLLETIWILDPEAQIYYNSFNHYIDDEQTLQELAGQY